MWLKLKKYAKSWESKGKSLKMWESVQKIEKIWESVQKIVKVLESVPKLEKVWESGPKLEKVGESISMYGKCLCSLLFICSTNADYFLCTGQKSIALFLGEGVGCVCVKVFSGQLAALKNLDLLPRSFHLCLDVNVCNLFPPDFSHYLYFRIIVLRFFWNPFQKTRFSSTSLS